MRADGGSEGGRRDGPPPPAVAQGLVPLSERAAPRGPSGARWRHRSASFLAQLIATAQQAPQTRSRRRAEPQDAAATYAAVGARRCPPPRRSGGWSL